METGTHILCAAAILLHVASVVQAAESIWPPTYRMLRYAEDWSPLRDPAMHTDWFDPLKFIPLDGEGDWFLTRLLKHGIYPETKGL